MKTLKEQLKTNFSHPVNRLATLLVLILLSVQYSAFGQKKQISEMLEKPEYSTLQTLMSSAEMFPEDTKSGGYTFFAPTNDAFEALGEETLKYLYNNPEEFAKILSYHFVNSKVYASDLSDGQVVQMRDGTDAFISLFDGKAYINQAQITKTDLNTFTGVIHVIDAVITQPQSIVDIVVNSPRHNTLEAVVIAAELAGALSAEGSFTLFAPTDDAFAALGTETINTLLEDPTGTLAEILKYHVVGATAFSGDLSDGDMFTTLEGSDIKVTINEEGVFINDAQVVFADYAAPNGVVHVIDAVITPPVPTNTVVDVIVNSEVHNTLEAAVIAAELAGALSSEGPFTVFAPTDEAFAALGEATINSLLEDPTGALAQILQYHVVAGSVMAGDLSDGQKVEMLEGTDAYVSLFDGKAYINQAVITVTDIVADNGVVHVIDAVITQPQSIVDIVVNSPRHNTLEAAVIAAELAGALSAEGSFTLFAPTDDAFAAHGEETIAALLEDPTGTLAEILKYHVVGATAFSGDLSDGDMFTTLEGSDIKVMINEEGVFINDAQVVFADYAAPNGVVHVIDAVITPPVPTNTVVDVIVNSEVHETLEAAVIAADLAGALSSEGPFTVFAPTDEAFAALGEATINSLLADPTGALAQILQYHVVAGSVMAGDLSDGQKVEMLEGTDAYVSLFDGKAYINQAVITVTDIVADNGVVHVIDAVITQPKSILDLIAINPRLTWLLEAIYAAGLDEFLSGTGYFTIFAPSDDAWRNYLEDAFGDNGSKAVSDYSDLLAYHTMEIETYSNELFDGDILETLSGMDIKVTVNQDGVHVNDSRIIYPDFTAPNGALHIVDEVIAEESIGALGINDLSITIGNANIYPNPASSRTTVSFELEESSEIEIVLHDLSGKTVKSEYFGYLPAGSQVMDLELDYLDAGLYIVNIKTGAASLSKKLRIE